MTNVIKLAEIKKELLEFRIATYKNILPVLENWKYKNGKPKKIGNAGFIQALEQAAPNAYFYTEYYTCWSLKIEVGKDLLSSWNKTIKEVLPDFEKEHYLNTSYIFAIDTRMRLPLSRYDSDFIDIDVISADWNRRQILQQLDEINKVLKGDDDIFELYGDVEELKENLKKIQKKIEHKENVIRKIFPFGLDENIAKRYNEGLL